MAAPKTLDEALLVLQSDPPTLVKDKKGQVGNQKTKYADLVQVNAVVLARLNALGVVYKTKPCLRAEEPRFVLRYELKHVPSGTSEDGEYPLKLSENPMQMGSAITYARLYVLLALTGVAAEDEDDDGGGAAAGHRYAQRNRRQQGPSVDGEGRPAQRGQRPRDAGPALPSEDPDGPVGPDQHRHMRALWNDLDMGGEENRDARLTDAAEILGLADLSSSATMTRGQADRVISALRARKEQGGEPR
jgi:hypothetical protein